MNLHECMKIHVATGKRILPDGTGGWMMEGGAPQATTTAAHAAPARHVATGEGN